MVSLGYGLDGKRARKKVRSSTKSEVRDKLKDRHTDFDAGVRPVCGYTLGQAVADWLADGLPGRAAKTVEVNRDSLERSAMPRPRTWCAGTSLRWSIRPAAGTGARRSR